MFQNPTLVGPTYVESKNGLVFRNKDDEELLHFLCYSTCNNHGNNTVKK